MEAKLIDEVLIVPKVGALEDLVDLEGGLSRLKALLNDIGRVLELAESDKVARDEVEDLVVSNVILELEHVLDQVIAVRVLDQHVDASDDHIGQGQLLREQAFLKAALHHTAAVLVRPDLVAVGHAGCEDELSVGGVGHRSWSVALFWSVRSFEGQQEGLDHVVAIGMCREVEDVLRHLGANCQDLLVKGGRLAAEHLNESLDGTGAMQVHGDLNDRGQAGVDELLQA